MPAPKSSPKALSPIRITALATQKLPRWTLWLLCFAYIIPGLFGRDPWKSEDVINIGTMLTALEGNWSQWILPEAFGIAVAEGGPLNTWVGVSLMWLLAPILEPIVVARLLQIFWFAITCFCIWYGVFLLTKRSEVQPTPLPFDDQPSHTSFGRMLADASLLLFIATLGLVLKHHESSALMIVMSAHALFFYGVARSIERPLTGLFCITLGFLLSFFSYGFPGVFPLLLAYLLLYIPRRVEFTFSKWLLLIPLTVLAISFQLWVSVLTRLPNSDYWWSLWTNWNFHYFGLKEWKHILFIIKNITWFLWPSLPLALYTLWRWHAYRHFIQLHIAGSLFFSALIFLAITATPGDAEGIAFIIPCIVMGSLALPVLKRSRLNALDWFAVMSFSFIILLIWFGWFAVMTGIPPKIAANFARQTVGFEFQFSWWTFCAGILITATWVATVCWRIYSKPSELWRGTVLSATGIVISWLLLTTFFLSAVDYGKSYRSVAAELAQVLATEDYHCIQGFGVGAAQRSSFMIFERISLTYNRQCTLALVQTNRDALTEVLNRKEYQNATVLWQSHRASDRSERLLLLRMPKSVTEKNN